MRVRCIQSWSQDIPDDPEYVLVNCVYRWFGEIVEDRGPDAAPRYVVRWTSKTGQSAEVEHPAHHMGTIFAPLTDKRTWDVERVPGHPWRHRYVVPKGVNLA